jgi:hypothetical protein
MPKPPVRVVIYAPPTVRYYEQEDEAFGPFLDDVLLNEKRQPIQGDITQRLNYLISLIKRANGELGMDGPEVLKLFIAPEWFFRRKGDPYSLKKEVKPMLQSLLKQSTTPALKSWLILPGSIVWGKKTGEKWTIYNLAPAVHNGQLLSLVHKSDEGMDIPRGQKNRYSWGIYDMATNLPPTAEREKEAIKISKEVFTLLGRKPKSLLKNCQGFFNCQGIDFALNICADQQGRLKYNVTEEVEKACKKRLGLELSNIKKEQGEIVKEKDVLLNEGLKNAIIDLFDEKFADVQLLVSCGATFDANSTVAKRGGYLIQSDGKGEPESDLQKKMLGASVRQIPGLKLSYKNIAKGGQFIEIPNVNSSNVDSIQPKRVFPDGSTDPFTRIFIFDELLDLNPAPVAATLQSTFTNVQ